MSSPAEHHNTPASAVSSGLLGRATPRDVDPQASGRFSAKCGSRRMLRGCLAARAQRPVPACTTASSSASSSNAVCTARAAAWTLSARVTTEMRISLVEIISMLMPAS